MSHKFKLKELQNQRQSISISLKSRLEELKTETADGPLESRPWRRRRAEGGRAKGPLREPAPEQEKTTHCDAMCVRAKGRAVGLEQSGAIKTGHGSGGPSRS